MVREFLTAAMLTTLIGGGAQAADDILADPVYDWAGLYAGVQAGYTFGTADHTFSNGAPTGDSSPDGFLGGVHVGYNLQSGQVVYGVEADINYSNADGTYGGIGSAGSTEMNWTGSVRGRLGMAYDNFLGFVTGGVAFGGFDFAGGPSLPVFSGYSDTEIGWTVGAGAQYGFMENWSARLEYRYTDFGTASGALVPGFSLVGMNVDVKTHAVLFGISYKFGP